MQATLQARAGAGSSVRGAAAASASRRSLTTTTVAVLCSPGSVAVAPSSSSPRRFVPSLPPSARRPVPSFVNGAVVVGARDVVRRGLFGLGLPELAVIAGVAALIFGPSKLPSLGKELGKTVKSFQTAAKEFESELKTAASDDEEKPEEKKAE